MTTTDRPAETGETPSPTGGGADVAGAGDAPVAAEGGPAVPRALWREAVGLLPDLGRLLRALVRDPRTPRRAKVLAGLAAGYVASPIDVLPDVVPGVGGIDDLLVVLWAVRRLVATAGYDLVRELWTGTDQGFVVLVVVAGIEG